MDQPKLSAEAICPFKAVKEAPGIPADEVDITTGHCFTHTVQVFPVEVHSAVQTSTYN